MSRTSSHALNKLNDVIIRATVKERERAATGAAMLADGGGLYLRIEAGGGARWKFRYAKANGNRGELGLGGYPAVSLATARDLAREQRDRKSTGADLVHAKRDARAKAAEALKPKPTFGEVADRYVREKATVRSTNEKHKYQWRQSLGPAYCSGLRDLPIDQVGTADVLAVLTQALTRTPRYSTKAVTGTMWTVMPDTASRLLDRIRRVLDFAAVEGLRAGDNPARWTGHLEHRLAPVRRGERHQPSMHYRQVPGFVAQLPPQPGMSSRAMEFLILTACRSSEIREAVWAEFDFIGNIWTIPAARMKARVQHTVPLTPRMLAILNALAPAGARTGLVFPGNKPGRPLSNMAFKALMNRMGVANVTSHGFRSSFRNWAGDEYRAMEEVAEAALAHSFGSKVRNAYRGDPAFDSRIQMMLAWDRYCAGAQDNVVRLRA
jgi:integrase